MDKKIFSGLIPRLSLVFLVTTQASAQLGSDLRITAVDTLITYESGTLAGAVDLHVGPDGEVYVVDRLNSQVHRLAASGEQLSSGVLLTTITSKRLKLCPLLRCVLYLC